MSNRCEFLAFLHQTNAVNQLMRRLNDHVSTRSMCKRLTTSCRKWQLVLLCMLHVEPYIDISRIHAVLEIILQRNEREYPTPLRSLIVRNRPSPTEVAMVSTCDDIAWFDAPHHTRVACMCLYIANYPTLRHSDGCILHYFTLLTCANHRMYLNSSYGSDYVRVSQRTRSISKRVLNGFCAAIQTPVASERVIRTFFEAFFTPRHATTTSFEHENETERRGQWTVDECIDSEMRVYTHNLYPIAVGQLTHYSKHLLDAINHVSHLGASPSLTNDVAC